MLQQLKGSFVGSIFFGYQFEGFAILDFIFIGFFIVVGAAIIRALRSVDQDGQVGPEPGSRAHQHAEHMWRRLEGAQKPELTATEANSVANVNAPKGFDAAEFLKGAKMAYARVHEAWENRDMEDLQLFVTDKAYDEYAVQAQANLAKTRSAIMLLDAKLLEVEERHGSIDATVDFNAQLKNEGSSETRNEHAVWRFTKPAKDPKATWKLDEIQRMQ